MQRERIVYIRTAQIALGALLKWGNLAATGGEAKTLIGEGRVRVNGEVELRRGRKIITGDRVDVEGTETTLVIRHSNAPAAPPLGPRVP